MSLTPFLSIVAGGSLVAAALGQPMSMAKPDAQTLASTALSSSFTGNNPQDNLETKLDNLSKNTTAASDPESERLADIARSQNIQAESKLQLAHDRAFALETEAGYTMLRIPFEESAGTLPESGVSVYFDANSTVVSTGEIVLTEVSDTSGTVEFWQDGRKLADRLITEPAPSSSNGTVHTAFSWGTFNDCLASAGIASWAITAIGVACGAACAVTVGIGCVVCATATAGIAGTTIGTCAGQAMA